MKGNNMQPNDPRYVLIENFNWKMNEYQIKNLKHTSRGIDEVVFYIDNINVNEYPKVTEPKDVTLTVQGLDRKGKQIYFKEYGVHLLPNPTFKTGNKSDLIVLEIGHSPRGDRGAWCKRKDISEHELNEVTAIEAKKQLRNLGFHNVEITDDSDSLWNIGFKFGRKADVIVSIHHNAYNTKVQGSECLYSPKGNKDDIRLAELIATECAQALKIPNRGAKEMGLSVLSGATHARMTEQDERGLDACVLSEGYFMTAHDVDDHYVWSKKYGIALANAIGLFLDK